MPAISTPTLTLTKLISRSPPAIQPPISDPSDSSFSFKLDSASLAGFFGGDSAWKSIATAYVLDTGSRVGLPGGFVVGSYNSPGAYEVVKRCAPIVSSAIWDSIFDPGERRDWAAILGLDAKSGPTFLPASGRLTLRTGHPAYLIARRAQQPLRNEVTHPSDDTSRVTVVDLRRPKLPAHPAPEPFNVIADLLACMILLLKSLMRVAVLMVLPNCVVGLRGRQSQRMPIHLGLGRSAGTTFPELREWEERIAARTRYRD